MARIDCYLATISPFSYLMGTRPAEVAAKHGAEIVYRPFDIMGLFGRTGGTPPKDRHPSRQAYRLQDLRRTGAKLGMAINPKPAHWPTNPAPSSYAIIAAQETGADVSGLVHALTRACWAEERDIAQDDVIRDCLVAEGFDAGLADSGLMAGADAYASNTEAAVQAGVFGAPSFVTGEEVFWGQDKIEDLDLHLAGKL